MSSEQKVTRKLRAILSADVKGYSILMADNEVTTIQTLKDHRKIMSARIEMCGGRVVDAVGDNLLAEFGSAVDAVQCAVEVQKELKDKNQELPVDKRLQFRIGINIGDVIQDGNRIFGDGVNIAARIEGLAEAGGVCISRNAYDHIRTKLNLGYEYLGEHNVKNISQPVRVYKVLMGPTDAGKLIGEEPTRPKKKWLLPAAVVAAIVVTSIVWYFIQHIVKPDIEPASIENMAFPLPDKPSVAVLPFDNMSGDSGQEYIADGITENIISALSKISEMFVIARNSTFMYKGSPVKVQKVAEELGVRYVLEGSVQKSGNRVRVTAQLVDAIKGHHLWAEQYDRAIIDFFDLLDEITKEIAIALQMELTHGEQARIWHRSTSNFKAWGHAVKGYSLFLRFTKEDNAKARQLFKQALELDPEYAFAWTFLAWTYIVDVRFGYSDSPAEDIKRGIEIAHKATEIDDTLPDIHSFWNTVYMIRKKLDKALESGVRAITLGPNDPNSHVLLAQTKIYNGNFDEAIGLVKKANRLTPYYPAWHLAILGWAQTMARRYEQAIATLDQLLKRAGKGEFSPFMVHYRLAQVYIEIGQEEKARIHAEKILQINPTFSLENYRKARDFYRDPIHLERVFIALRKAGLPDKPPLELPDKPSIAVLPFDNLSNDPEQEYFSDGITDDLITDLSRISGLFVIARNSAFQYKGKAVDLKRVGRELGVRYVLEGSVRKSEKTVRINAQLIDAATGAHLWAERYDEQMGNIFSLQDKITQKIVEALAVNLTIDEKVAIPRKETENLEAYLTFLKGWQHYRRFNPEAFLEAIPLFERAIDLDPNYWRAYAALAKIYLETGQRPVWSQSLGLSSDAAFRRANKYLYSAMKGPTPLAYEVSAEVHREREDFDGAIAEAKRAVSLDHSDSDSHFAMGEAFKYSGRHKEAVDSYKKAMRLDPFYQDNFAYGLGSAYFFMAQFEKAAALCERSFRSNSQNEVPLWFIAAAYGHLGREQEAKAALAKHRELNPQYSYLRYLKYAFQFKDPADFNLLADGLRKAGMD